MADLNLPRYGHSMLNVNGEPTVIGGHTTNFVPTPTLEYYKNGKWHLMPTAFTHDDGCVVELTTGKVLIVGGHERNLGIGQSYEVELYDPQTHTSEGFSSLDTKRAMASALAMDDGCAVIVGNWHHEDGIEMYDGKGGFLPVKDASCGRANPYILRTTKDDAIIFTSLDSKGEFTPHPVIDQLHGETYREPFFEEWGLRIGYEQTPSTAFIGNEAMGDYSYLLVVENEAGQVAIARVTNGEFSLMPTDVSIPMSCRWGAIAYGSHIFADMQNRRAYLLGTDSLQYQKPCAIGRIYVITIDYAHLPAHLTLGYTDILSEYDIRRAVMTSEGDLMLAGGMPTENNFKPTAATWLIHLNPHAQKAGTGMPLWSWLLIFLGLVALAAWLIMLMRRKKRNRMTIEALSSPVEDHIPEPDIPIEDSSDTPNCCEENAELMHRICKLMEQQQLYLNPNMKMADLATALGTNRSVISNCINSQCDCSFPKFVNTYRVAYAQDLLRNHPDLKVAQVWMNAGFSSEASFYRIFKVITGTTPNAWKTNL